MSSGEEYEVTTWSRGAISFFKMQRRPALAIGTPSLSFECIPIVLSRCKRARFRHRARIGSHWWVKSQGKLSNLFSSIWGNHYEHALTSYISLIDLLFGQWRVHPLDLLVCSERNHTWRFHTQTGMRRSELSIRYQEIRPFGRFLWPH